MSETIVSVSRQHLNLNDKKQKKQKQKNNKRQTNKLHTPLPYCTNASCGLTQLLMPVGRFNPLVGRGGGRGGELRGEGCNLKIILIRVWQPVFRDLPQSYTWPIKKRIHSYTGLSEMLTNSYTVHWYFCTHLLLVVRQILQAIHWIPREQAA